MTDHSKRTFAKGISARTCHRPRDGYRADSLAVTRFVTPPREGFDPVMIEFGRGRISLLPHHARTLLDALRLAMQHPEQPEHPEQPARAELLQRIEKLERDNENLQWRWGLAMRRIDELTAPRVADTVLDEPIAVWASEEREGNGFVPAE